MQVTRGEVEGGEYGTQVGWTDMGEGENGAGEEVVMREGMFVQRQPPFIRSLPRVKKGRKVEKVATTSVFEDSGVVATTSLSASVLDL